MGYKIIRGIVNLIVICVARLHVVGVEKVPTTGSFIATANHIGRLDAIMAYKLTDRRDIILLVAEKYRKIPLAPWLVKHLDAIWVDRYNADFTVLREVLKRLRKGGMLVLAPEGTRSPTGVLQAGRAGASYLAAKSGVPIIPVGLIGSDDAFVFPRLKHLKRTTVTIHVGDPFVLPPLPNQNREIVLQQYTDEIMCRIAALLPLNMQGFYANHPRLAELLASKEKTGD